ncbi:hypothetical protein AOCH_003949 [Aspergillus ochraceoroseus]|uniref:Transmembrane protein n=1 Tax=Aspergillus ochraceoroseus TaxID=138278 RepID=A0A0F8WC32_9EURO|nr:hypothetical protein AOCH_003949 [Aspergillus ochraceoroseus]
MEYRGNHRYSETRCSGWFLWTSGVRPTDTFIPTTSALTLALLTSLGGIIGYARTGSIPSIAAGVSIGALYLVSFLRLKSGQPYGAEIGLLASLVLGGSSVPRAIRSRKPVPVGLSVMALYGIWAFGGAVYGKSG